MTAARLIEALAQLKAQVWRSGGARAPHKPLLLLLTLGRVRRGDARLASYAEHVHQPLKKLLRDFGPSGSTLHPEYPFWHLHSATGELWELAGAERLSVPPRRSANSGDLIRHGVSGGLPESLHGLLRRDPDLLRAAADRLLFDHFPESMHDAIREQVGLPRDSVPVVREGGRSPAARGGTRTSAKQ